jgi:hypothetical protein
VPALRSRLSSNSSASCKLASSSSSIDAAQAAQ